MWYAIFSPSCGCRYGRVLKCSSSWKCVFVISGTFFLMIDGKKCFSSFFFKHTTDYPHPPLSCWSYVEAWTEERQSFLMETRQVDICFIPLRYFLILSHFRLSPQAVFHFTDIWLLIIFNILISLLLLRKDIAGNLTPEYGALQIRQRKVVFGRTSEGIFRY